MEKESKGFVKAITAPKVRDTLIAALLHGSGDHRCQLALYQTCRDLPREVLQEDKLSSLVAAIRAQTESPELRGVLDDISQVERLLVTANVLFNYLRRQDGEPLEAAATTINGVYRFGYLSSAPDLASVPYGLDLEKLRVRLRADDTLGALHCLLEMNKKIMAGRGGAAWVEKTGDGRLRVRVKAETANLPPLNEMQSSWDYDYFLRSFARIAAMERR